MHPYMRTPHIFDSQLKHCQPIKIKVQPDVQHVTHSSNMVEEKAERPMIRVKVNPVPSDNLFMKIFNKKCYEEEGHLGCNRAHPWCFVSGNIYEQLALAVTLFLVAPHAA